MVTIIFNENRQGIKAAVDMANQLLANQHFYQEIAAHPQFDMSDATPVQIAEVMQQSHLTFKVVTFTPRFLERVKYRKTYAYTDPNYPNILFLNSLKLDREVEDIAATIIHEAVHAIDDECEPFSFGHGDNSAYGKDNTAPYWIGNLAFKLLKNDTNATLVFAENTAYTLEAFTDDRV